jgi:Flp pilus assembly protein protease CpaA
MKGKNMIAKYVVAIVTCIAAIFIGIILGNSVVWVFNKIPGKWLCDYGKEPDEELLHPTRQRINSVPWKYWFSCVFVLAAIKLGLENPIYAVIALITCWILAEMAIADIKYMIVPDQFIILLMVAAIGFVPHQKDGAFEGILGGLIGFGIMLIIGILGKIIYKRDALGGGDIKLFGALGLCLGVNGILAVFVLSTFITAFHLGYLTITKRLKPADERPLIPYIAIAAAIYLVIFHNMSYNIMVYL